MYMYVYIYIYIYIYTIYMYGAEMRQPSAPRLSRTCTLRAPQVRQHIYLHKHIYTYTGIDVYTYTYICIDMYVYMYVDVIYIYIYIHIHIYIHMCGSERRQPSAPRLSRTCTLRDAQLRQLLERLFFGFLRHGNPGTPYRVCGTFGADCCRCENYNSVSFWWVMNRRGGCRDSRRNSRDTYPESYISPSIWAYEGKRALFRKVNCPDG